MIRGKCNEVRPCGRGRFTLGDSMRVNVKEIMYIVIE